MELKEISPEEYDFEAAFEGATPNTDKITLYFDTQLASETLSKISQLQKELDRQTAEVLSITEESTAQKLLLEIDAAKDQSVTLTLRALSDKEEEKIYRKVYREYRIDKKLPADEREFEAAARNDFIQELLIARAVVGVEDYVQGVKTTALSDTAISAYRKKLPKTEWQRLVGLYEEVQVSVAGYTAVLSEPTFRSGLADITGESEVDSGFEAGEGESYASDALSAGEGEVE